MCIGPQMETLLHVFLEKCNTIVADIKQPHNRVLFILGDFNVKYARKGRRGQLAGLNNYFSWFTTIS